MKHTDLQRNDQATGGTNPLVPASPYHPISGIPPEERYHPPPFDPVPVKPRHDGWTPERQQRFIEALGATACVEDSARAVGMSATSAHNLHARPDAVAFRGAWAAALQFSIARLEAAVFSRAIYGVPVPHYYKGELIGEHRKYNDHLAMFLIRHNDLGRYAKGWDGVSPHEFDGGTGPQVRAKKYIQRLAWLDPDADENDGADESGDRDIPL